jgi:hypothetical protein
MAWTFAGTGRQTVPMAPVTRDGALLPSARADRQLLCEKITYKNQRITSLVL